MNKKLIYIITTVVIVVALIISLSIYVYDQFNFVAKVSGEKITVAEFNFFLSLSKSEMTNAAGIDGNDPNAVKSFWSSQIEGKNAVDVAKEKALDAVKVMKIQKIMAKQAKIKLEKKDLADIDSALKEAVNGNGGKTKFEESLKNYYNINLEQYKAIYRDFTLVSKYEYEEQNKIKPTEDEINKFTSEYKSSIEKVTVRHILLLTVEKDSNGNPLTDKPFPQDKQDEVRKSADDVLAKIRAGEDMKALVKKYSQDTGSLEQEGEYTFSMNDGYTQAFKDWAFSAKVGDTGVVKTEFGYHVMKLEKKTTPEEIKAISENGVKQEKYSKQLEELKKDPQYNIIKNEKVYSKI